MGRWRMAALAVALIALAGCGERGSGIRGSGTIEFDEIDVASLVGGRVTRLRAEEGDLVHAGDTLATLERGELTAAVDEQSAQAARAKALLSDQEAGARQQELRVARADRDAAMSDLNLAESEFKRVQSLFNDRVAAAADLDRARSSRDASKARVDAATEQVALMEAGSRSGQVAAARAAAQAANASAAGARSRSQELVLTAPADGVVLLRNANRGEVVGPGAPVYTLGDPERLWIRVYVGAPLLPRVRRGAHASIRVNGVARDFPGRVIEIATRAEFTPRAALTEEERSNLVFGVKVAIDSTDGVLKPGLPADVTIESDPVSGATPK
ncbi:MAG: HlyD family secretion protein [Candidatus Eiseniibacteriota bacterium]